MEFMKKNKSNHKIKHKEIAIMTIKEERFKVRCAVYIILRRETKILFLRRSNTSYMNGYYALPAGHVEEGESFMQAAIREAKEEINIEVTPCDLSLVLTSNQHCHVAEDEYVDLFFEVKNYKNEIKNNEPNFASELDFFTIDEIKDSIIPHTLNALYAIAENKNYLEFDKTKQ